MGKSGEDRNVMGTEWCAGIEVMCEREVEGRTEGGGKIYPKSRRYQR